MWYKHKVKYYQALKKGNTFICFNMFEPGEHAKISQTQKSKYDHLYEQSKMVKLMEAERGMVVARDRREEDISS